MTKSDKVRSKRKTPPESARQRRGISESERRKLLFDWNDTARPLPDACLHQLFEAQAARSPDAVAVSMRERRVSYRQLNERANRLAHLLRRRGVEENTLVGVCLRRSPELVVALLAAWKAGAAYVPLDPSYPPGRLSFMAEDSDVALVLTERAYKHLFQASLVEALSVDEDWHLTAGEDAGDPGKIGSSSRVAYVMYTSGSTGQPKGAVITHRGLVNYVLWAIEAYGTGAHDSTPLHSSIAFDLTVTSLYPALLVGGEVELLEEDAGAEALVAALRRRGGRALVKITPAHLDVLTQELRPHELEGLTRALVIGGESLQAESLEPWRERAPRTRLINEYGPTETVVGCSIHEVRPEDAHEGPVPIGRPIANTQLYVLGDDMEPVPPGDAGELYVGGAGVANGYLHRAELTQARFLPDPFARRRGARLYKTGDRVRQRPDGTLEFLGRLDDQVKVSGYRIELGEVESVLKSHEAVRSCAVLARDDLPGGRQLVGYVVSREGEKPDAADLQAVLRQRLPGYMTVARFVFLEALPLTPNGKVDRAALPVPAAAIRSRDHALPPLTAIEATVAGVWKSLLDVDGIEPDADFFALGGNSLAAVRAIAKLRDELGVDLSTVTMFQHPTLRDLSAWVDARRAQAAAARRIPARGATGPCVASFAQEQMWLLEQLVPGGTAYTIADVVTLRGTWDGPALASALAAMVRRHEALRTTFAVSGGVLLQSVAPPFEPALPEVDVSPSNEEERQRDWAGVVRAERQIPFDLSRLPLFRATVVHVSPDEHRVLVTIHHAIADEWSMDVLRAELVELYAALCNGRPPRLEPLPIQVADHAVWQRELLTQSAIEEHLAYARKELDGAQFSLALPADKPRPAAPSLSGGRELFEVPSDTGRRLSELCTHEQATPFMVLLASFAVFLARHAGQSDLLVGTPISRRTHTETQRLIGCFLNTVVVRARVDGDSTFRELCRDVRARVIEAFAHADLPFERLVSEFGHARTPGHAPMVQAMFVLHSPGWSVFSKHELDAGTAKLDLTLAMSPDGEGYRGAFEYRSDLFEPETARRFGRSLRVLLDAAVRSPDIRISELPILAEEDTRQLVVERNRTAAPECLPGLCAHELFERTARDARGQTAIVFGAHSLTYGELADRADRLAERLVRRGVEPDMPVGLMTERSLDMVVGLLGILKAGGAYVPLEPSFPAVRLAAMVRASGMRVLVTHRALDAALPVSPPSIVRLDEEDGEDEREGPFANLAPRTQVTPENLAYVLFTSGSTGEPKGVMVPHVALVNFLLSMQREPGLRETDTLLAVTTMSFDIAALEIFLPLVSGAKVVLLARDEVLDPRRILERLTTHGCTVLQATPATWRSLVEAGWLGTPELKALCGGEALPPELARLLLPRCGELWNMYGPTETTVWSTVHRMAAQDTDCPIGHPIANTQAYVVDERLRLVPPGVVGELVLGGHGVARGYLNRPELTAEKFVPSPFVPGARLYRTGDFARARADGALVCLGRADHQVKVRGHRIELGDVEACLARHPAVREVVAVASDDPHLGKRLVAYVVPHGRAAELRTELRALLHARLPEYMAVSEFVFVDALPRTSSGKVDRKSLPPSTGAIEPGEEHAPPRSELEASLVAVWQRVLGVRDIGVDDDFFERGGSSLTILKLMAELERTTGLAPSLGSLFAHPTIAGLVESLGSRAAESASLLVPLQQMGEGRPVFCVSGIRLYQDLATALGTEQPVFGVYVAEEEKMTREALEGRRPDVSVAALAEGTYRAIVKASPCGPYRLVGSSFGGIVAMEVADRMRRAGAEVELVALLDTLSPRGIRRRWGRWLDRRLSQVARGEAPRKVSAKLDRVRDRLRVWGLLRGERKPELVAEAAYERKQVAYYDAIKSWKNRKLASDYPVVLFRAIDHGWGPQDELDWDYGWRAYIHGPLTVVDLPGSHLGILERPYVDELARQLKERLH